MATTIAFRFLTGRYHATPWDKQVNEGVPEWPPAPWRILRAMVAVWKRTLPHLTDKQVQPVLELLSEPPSYHLPPTVLAHTRHYMPWDKHFPKQPPETDRTLIFDTFLALSPKVALEITWQQDLNPNEREVLAELLGHMTYLGRSESWCEARLLEAPTREPNCIPAGGQSAISLNGESEGVRVLCPQVPLNMEALTVETAALRKQRLDPTHPPGSAWVPYLRPAGWFVEAAPVVSQSERAPVTAMRFALDARPLPRIQDAVNVGDLARRAAMSWYGRLNGGGPSSILAGKDADGVPLQGHRHAHYFPTDEEGRGRITHLTVYAPAGLDDAAQTALGKVAQQGLRRPEETPWGLTFLAAGPPSDRFGSLFRKARVWESMTPFVPPRHTRRGKELPDEQVVDELARRNLPAPTAVERLPEARIAGRTAPWLSYHRWRGKGSRVDVALGFRLRFSDPVPGPIALGYGSHYGLGLFMPGREDDDPEQG